MRFLLRKKYACTAQGRVNEVCYFCSGAKMKKLSSPKPACFERTPREVSEALVGLRVAVSLDSTTASLDSTERHRDTPPPARTNPYFALSSDKARQNKGARGPLQRAARSPVSAGGARLGAGGLDALDHQARRAVLQADGEHVAVVADDGDDPAARLRISLRTKAERMAAGRVMF